MSRVSFQSMEFFLFAALMVLDMLLFFYLAFRYTYLEMESKGGETKKPIEENAIKQLELTTDGSLGKDNKGFDVTAT